MNKFKEAPPRLKIFLVFSIFGHFAGLAFFPKGYLTLTAYTGSNSFIPYLFGNLYFFPSKKHWSYDKVKLYITRLFVFIMIFGIGEIYFFDKLVVGITLESIIWYRIVSVFVVPVFWIILLSKGLDSLIV